MACTTSSFQSNCFKDQQDEQQDNTIASNVNNRSTIEGLCFKCKINPPISADSDSDADASRFCADCFRGNLFGKFRFAVSSNALISLTDKVLVAFSGGPSSRVALQFVHEMHYKSQKNFDASMDRSLPVFGVGVAYVDESSVCSVPSSETDKAIKEIRSIVESLAPPMKELYVVPVESVY